MKTIKELEAEWKTEYHRGNDTNELYGKIKALKDVLGLIDECMIPYPQGKHKAGYIDIEELKSRITG